MPFEMTFHVAWAHLDANGHMANTAYLDIAVGVRMMYFASQGFPASEFARLRIGPVVRRDEVDYYREDGQLAARLTSLGGWFDLNVRKLVAPPEALANAIRALDKTDDFEKLESSLRK